MLKKTVWFCVIFFALVSCATDKINLSPFSESLVSENNTVSVEAIAYSYANTVNSINYSSEITNLLSSFPTFKNNTINAHVDELKYVLQNYIYSIEASNNVGETRYMKRFIDVYKKLQNSKNKLSQDEQEILNRYLVRLKTNISALENFQKDSTATANKKQ